MSIMDFFASQGTAVPSTGSSGGDWQDWFLDMEGRKPYGRTVYPDPDAERGDWMDWFLNREGPAGKFRGSRRPRYGIDYLFNDGGSVRSEGRPGGGGPGGRPSLPAPTPAPTWDTEREYNKFQTRANEPGARLAEQWAFDMQRERDQWPWTLDVTREGQPRGQHKRKGHWKVKSSNFRPRAMLPANEGQDLGIMTATAAKDYSPDGQGTWMTQSPWGQKVLSGLVNQFGSEGSSEYLQDAIGKGGIPLWGGALRPTWEDDQYGFEWSIGG